jgi:hypothetical protein
VRVGENEREEREARREDRPAERTAAFRRGAIAAASGTTAIPSVYLVAAASPSPMPAIA